ncbi:MAG TPA: sigma-54 dependent transcriptional regulator, partial [Polyangiaceae bacterium LLY-WYZ-15_(1-7)]|nr:sigma-54 dependent transcriptional regulator [Polyangiaceae bacterium LLY-WYZ-15_(1-7)]
AEWVERVRAARGSASIVALAARTDAALLGQAVLEGADQALPREAGAEAIVALVRRAWEKPRYAEQAASAERAAHEELDLSRFPGIVGSHPVMIRLLRRVAQVARSRATVLIHGETGTGKELIAGAIHTNSKRAAGPFVKLNCAALAESVLESELFGHERGAFTGAQARRIGRFEQADGGTLFLDEVSELSLSLQVKLLRFLQERELERVGGNETVKVDVRVVAATNEDLGALVKSGRFREDLYYRLNVVRLEVPPLRARPSDVLELASHFLVELAAENEVEVSGFTEAAKQALLAHPWPGNVRALRNAIETAVVLCEGERVDVGDLPLEPAGEGDALQAMVPGVTLEELERWAILRTLRAMGSVQAAADALGISKRTIQYRLQSWGLTAKELLRDEA